MGADTQTAGLALRFRATGIAARRANCALGSWLSEAGLPDDRSEDIRIAVAEAVNNIVEHAYLGLAPGWIRLTGRKTARRVEICISDSGTPLPVGPETEGHPVDPHALKRTLPEGGFGWILIRKLTNRVHYRRGAGRNLLTLHFDLSTASQGL
ncbi:serine/threonine-protein kinase RsbW [Cribrihabitans marinus]|uniref:Serine/threonine-protein kinase RsbW n=1 Tax=Cribrihabitans marinus TaxID=1227549 RepID=A0A1H6XRS5_9RHOB|nr:ATP-binding protein [Cribrihabitans marinus]GGH27713.1 hypothetical protein GCM10010973_16180 [Cribrihabitans marinus]SEJ30304.1 serine/threonine-protein kinase RsbW [Cribrihabitans marinus]